MSVFAGEDVPEYEITQSTVTQLWRLASTCKERERRIETVIADMDQKTQEYAAESENNEYIHVCEYKN